jgi:hypothetical protein
VTDETPEHREIPLTLAFKPDDGKGDDPEYRAAGYEGIAIVQPSMEEEGRIFMGVNPFGKPVGVHMLPEDAERIRDHLSLLLLDKPDEEESPESLQSRIDRAVERVKASQPAPTSELRQSDRVTGVTRRRRRRSFPKPQFRVEFKWGAFEAILARLGK